MRFDQRNWASIELGLHCTFGRPSGFRTETQKKNESIFIGRRHSGTPFSFIVLRHRSFFYLKKKGSFLVFIHHSTFLGSSNAVGNGDVEPKFVGFVEFSQRTLASAAFSNFRAFSTHAHDATLTGVGGGGGARRRPRDSSNVSRVATFLSRSLRRRKYDTAADQSDPPSRNPHPSFGRRPIFWC